MSRASQAPNPPWVQYPDSVPWWSGWRQGEAEGWLHEVWLPYWQGLDADAREGYLRENPAPDEEWDHWLREPWAHP